MTEQAPVVGTQEAVECMEGEDLNYSIDMSFGCGFALLAKFLHSGQQILDLLRVEDTNADEVMLYSDINLAH